MRKSTKISSRTIFAVLVCIGFACSSNKKGLKIKKENKQAVEFITPMYPMSLIENKDSTAVTVGFFQTQMAFYLVLSEKGSRRNLEILKKAQKKAALVWISTVPDGQAAKILDVRLASPR